MPWERLRNDMGYELLDTAVNDGRYVEPPRSAAVFWPHIEGLAAYRGTHMVIQIVVKMSPHAESSASCSLGHLRECGLKTEISHLVETAALELFDMALFEVGDCALHSNDSRRTAKHSWSPPLAARAFTIKSSLFHRRMMRSVVPYHSCSC
jgi:hypothetical protein